MTRTRQKLLENFDDEVREKLKMRDTDSKASLNRFERWLMQLTKHELKEHAEFISDSSFRLKSHAFTGDAAAIPLGLYELPRSSGEAHLYRTNHPLADAVLARAKGRELPMAYIEFAYAERQGKISMLESSIGASGWLALTQFSIESLDQAEDHLIFAASADDGRALDEEAVKRLMMLPGRTAPFSAVQDAAINASSFEATTQKRQADIQRRISERNARLFEAEADKLDGWADDLKLGLEREIKELDRQIKEARRTATTALTLEDKLAGQKQIKAIEVQRNQKRRTLFDAQDQVDKQRAELIALIEGKLQQRTSDENLFIIRWSLR